MPAKIVTVAGTVASLVSLLARFTVNELLASESRVTVASVIPPSEMLDAEISRVNVPSPGGGSTSSPVTANV